MTDIERKKRIDELEKKIEKFDKIIYDLYSIQNDTETASLFLTKLEEMEEELKKLKGE